MAEWKTSELSSYRVAECHVRVVWEKMEDESEREEEDEKCKAEEDPRIEVKLDYEQGSGDVQATILGFSTPTMNTDVVLAKAVNEAIRRVKRRAARDSPRESPGFNPVSTGSSFKWDS
eukprot:TRINITY_DN10106_c0_g1_i1.p1 TRINITY_DN10106_c0_g1~~TRINITY_DN10106_c0_g1_i1.p1  ORF type:complete len:118 (+),score=16.86 TRINITY_DN10106_c0_g1_i1:431-784(+)